jgi:primary-amine oxidase
MTDYKPMPLDHQGDQRQDSKPTFTVSKRRAFFFLSILFNVLSIGFILCNSHGLKAVFSDGILGQGWHSGIDTTTSATTTNDDFKTSHCPASSPPRAFPPVPINLWASLTLSETSAIYTWLEEPERNLNLTRSNGSIVSDNLVYGIETYYPPKSEALAYLENPATSPPPTRFARVTIHHGGIQVPTVVDYLVGPLPVGPRTSMRTLKEIYHRNDIPFNARGFADTEELPLFLARQLAPISDVMEVSISFVSSL